MLLSMMIIISISLSEAKASNNLPLIGRGRPAVLEVYYRCLASLAELALASIEDSLILAMKTISYFDSENIDRYVSTNKSIQDSTNKPSSQFEINSKPITVTSLETFYSYDTSKF